ncbi:MAG: ribokinase, partial [Lachnospiraceae bacterium]|nr:ribokinase [Lachnospiraceae bacterium]
TGHALIQVSASGENNIILYPGANHGNTKEYVDSVISRFDEGDILTLQNEVNMLDYVVDKAYERGMRIFLNPSPFNDALKSIDKKKISTFVLNEVEGFLMTGEKEADRILDRLSESFAGASFVLTLGDKGSIALCGRERISCECVKSEVRDTTAAGDTYTGYLIASLARGMDMEAAMKRASKAASIAVSRNGAIPSIPCAREVDG